jgi:hypothetical protein
MKSIIEYAFFLINTMNIIKKLIEINKLRRKTGKAIKPHDEEN